MNSKGFTLVELLSIIVILGLIALLAIPSFTSILNRNKENLLKQKETLIRIAADKYSEDKGINNFTVGELIYSGYLKADSAESMDIINPTNNESMSCYNVTVSSNEVSIDESSDCSFSQSDDIEIQAYYLNKNKYEGAPTNQDIIIIATVSNEIKNGSYSWNYSGANHYTSGDYLNNITGYDNTKTYSNVVKITNTYVGDISLRIYNDGEVYYNKSIQLNIDKTPPTISDVGLEDGTLYFKVNGNDINSITLYKCTNDSWGIVREFSSNDEEYTYNLSDKGKYRIIAKDTIGNQSEYTIEY